MTTLIINEDANQIQLYVNEGIPGNITADNTVTLTNKTISYSDNTLTGVQPSLVSGTNIKTVGGVSLIGSGDVPVLSTNLANAALTNVKTLSFTGEGVLNSTSGAISVDWSAAQNYRQVEPTGSITYTFTAPPGPCHLQLRIVSDGASAAQTIVWPASVKWLLFTWTAIANKGAIINFWYDGTNYWAMGSNAV